MNLIDGPSSELPDHKPGRTVVAVGSKGSIALIGGTKLTWGERVFGGYKTFYSVDLSIKTIDLTFSVGSKKSALFFEATAMLTVQLTDPVAAVSANLIDLKAILSPSARKAVSDVARNFDVDDTIGAGRAAEAALQDLKLENGVKVVEVTVDLRPDQEAQMLLRTIHEEELKSSAHKAVSRHQKLQREDMQEVISSPDELLAQLLVTKDDIFRHALQTRLDQAATDQARKFEVMKALIDNKVIEAHDFHHRYPDFLNQVFNAIPLPSSSKMKALMSTPETESDPDRPTKAN